MKMKKLCRRILPLGLAAVLCLMLAPAAFAASAPADIHLELELSDSTVTYSVVSAAEYENAVAVTAVYKSGRMVGSSFAPISIAAGRTEYSCSFAKEFDDVQVTLLDASSFTLLCPSGGYKTVSFLDHDGTVLSTQRVLSGQSAVPPIPGERTGYVFTGWDGDYSCITDNCSFTAQYVAGDSPNIFTVSSVEAAVGEEIVVSVALTGAVELCGYNMNLVYDSSVLEFVSLDAELGMDVLANPITGEGRIKFNFGSRANRTTGGGVMDISFRILDTDAGYAAVSLKPIEVIGIDPGDSMKFVDVEYTVCEGVVLIK